MRKSKSNKSINILSPGRIPLYGERMKARTINMPETMYERLGREAEARGMTGGQSAMQRQINEWFFALLDMQKGDDIDPDKILGELSKSRIQA